MTVRNICTELVIEFTLIIVKYLLTEMGRGIGIVAGGQRVEACGELVLREGGLDWGHLAQLLTFTFRICTVLECKFTPKGCSDSLECGFGG